MDADLVKPYADFTRPRGLCESDCDFVIPLNYALRLNDLSLIIIRYGQ
jgi:hypothetical protein